MKIYSLIKSAFLILALSWFISGCENSNDNPSKTYKIGMISENFGDNSYNDNCKRGLTNVVAEFNIIAAFKDGTDTSVIRSNVEYFINQNYDLLFYAGFLFNDISNEYAAKYPNRNFVMIDFDQDSLPPNMLGISFEVQEAAFPLGFLAAYWADSHSNATAKTAAICGFDSKTLQKFYKAFDNGVKYYNSEYSKNVTNSTVFSNDFRDLALGEKIADSLIDNGVSVIFTVAGELGAGALKAVKDRGVWGIGVDDDQYLTLPSVKEVLLSSCMKNTESPVYDVTKNFISGIFPKGTIHKANLKSGGVGIAPYHNFESKIPADIIMKINQIKDDIISGKISPL